MKQRVIWLVAAFAAATVILPEPYAARAYHHYRENGGSIVRVETLAGPIRVAKRYADRFVGFINDLVAEGHDKLDIGCYAPTGHIRHSLHHWGGACDIDQTARNRTADFMRHVTALAREHHLEDGCTWRHPDCGHVQVPQTIVHHYAAVHRRYRYAAHQHRVRYVVLHHHRYVRL